MTEQEALQGAQASEQSDRPEMSACSTTHAHTTVELRNLNTGEIDRFESDDKGVIFIPEGRYEPVIE